MLKRGAEPSRKMPMGHVQRCAAHLLHIVGFGQPMAERMRGRDPGAQGHTLGIDRQAIMSKMATEKQRPAGNSQIAPL